MRHKLLAFLEAMMELEDSLDELVEADETYAGDVVSATEYTFRCSDRRKGEIFNAALDKKTGFDWRKIWQADCTHPGRKHRQAHRVALPMRMWQRNCCFDIPAPLRAHQKLWLRFSAHSPARILSSIANPRTLRSKQSKIAKTYNFLSFALISVISVTHFSGGFSAKKSRFNRSSDVLAFQSSFVMLLGLRFGRWISPRCFMIR